MARNKELQAKLHRLEAALRDLELDNADLAKELDSLKAAHSSLLETNYRLN